MTNQTDIQLVLSDMDNTVAPHMQSGVSSAVVKAVRDVQAKGITVSIVSGRAYQHAKETVAKLGINGYCVFDGGATIVDVSSEQIIWKKWMGRERVAEIIEAIRPWCYEVDYVSEPEHSMVAISKIQPSSITNDTPYVFATINESHREDIQARLAAIADMYVYFLNGVHMGTGVTSPCVYITDIEATKFHGVEALRGIIAIPKSATLAIGDGDNDLPLFENAHIKVAMGNATDDLKEKADFVTASFADDGFVVAMQKYILNSELSS